VEFTSRNPPFPTTRRRASRRALGYRHAETHGVAAANRKFSIRAWLSASSRLVALAKPSVYIRAVMPKIEHNRWHQQADEPKAEPSASAKNQIHKHEERYRS
jgi:hypothetical protein